MVTTTVLTVDELEDRVEKIINVLPDDLADEWLDRYFEEHQEDKTVLALGFWDAIRAAIRHLEERAAANPRCRRIRAAQKGGHQK